MPKPSCFDSEEQFIGWSKQARFTVVPDKKGCCVDCNPVFQAAMLAEGLCDHPETKFFRISNGLKGLTVEGERPGGKRNPRKPLTMDQYLKMGGTIIGVCR